MYTSDLRKKLNVPTPPLGAPRLQLHRGFWAAYSAVDKQVMQEVNKQLKLVKVRWGRCLTASHGGFQQHSHQVDCNSAELPLVGAEGSCHHSCSLPLHHLHVMPVC
jgi:hypothetical protein